MVSSGEAIPFITLEGNNLGKQTYQLQFQYDAYIIDLKIHEKAINFLNAIEGKISVVTITGLYRLGKSFLLNQLIEKPNGFKVGHTMNAETKGLWIWNQTKKVGDLNVIFVDTEGLGDIVERDVNTDLHIFRLAILVSSHCIYNVSSKIDHQTISSLSFVT